MYYYEIHSTIENLLYVFGCHNDILLRKFENVDEAVECKKAFIDFAMQQLRMTLLKGIAIKKGPTEV